MEEAINPEGVLKNIFNYCLQTLISDSRERGLVARRIILNLSSENLDSDLHVHIQKINADAAEALLHRFMILDQSNKTKGKDSLTSKPFTIDATTLASASNKRRHPNNTPSTGAPKRKRRRRIGAGRRRRFRPAHISIDRRRGLHEINNNDTNCLFRAIELLRVKAQTYKQDFYNYLRNEARQKEDVRNLMRALGVVNSMDGYEIETYGPRIQEHYDRLYPGQFKIFAFDAENPMKPYYSTDVVDYNTPICVLFSEDHFDAIKTLNTLLGVRAYCLSCEMPYHSQLDHNMKCLARCKNCGRIDPSGPCPNDGTPRNECAGCNKIFINT